MHYSNPNCPRIYVSDAMPMAREILKGSLRLASELASINSPCSLEEYLTHLANASSVLSKIVIHNLTMDGQNA